MYSIKLNGINETRKFGEKLASYLQEGDILCLNGDLGAGKTTLSKSIGKGLGVDDYITSPTFTLVNQYKGRLPVYHFDVYRLESPQDLEDIGFEEYIYGSGVSIIEWADKIRDILPEEVINLDITKGLEKDHRIVDLYGKGSSFNKLIEELKK